MKYTLILSSLALGFFFPEFGTAQPAAGISYGKEAAEVTGYIQKNFWDEKRDLYMISNNEKKPDHLWGAGVMFSALVGAARHDPGYVSIMRRYLSGLNSYWDPQAEIPGYEPSPTHGGGHDKYYDDNAWMDITFIEAYQLIGDTRYLKRAGETLDFVMSGWDERGGGGIWWHEKHKNDSKNTCANGPAAVGCFRMAKYSDAKLALKRIDDGNKIVSWTTNTLRGPNGLYGDSVKITTGEKNRDQLTYNSALMVRAYLADYSVTGNTAFLDEAKRTGEAANSLLSKQTHAYRDPIKWAHLMVEADLELYRRTGEKYLLERARNNCDYHYMEWKKSPPPDLISNAALARELWLMADRETVAGREFWKRADQMKNN